MKMINRLFRENNEGYSPVTRKYYFEYVRQSERYKQERRKYNQQIRGPAMYMTGLFLSAVMRICLKLIFLLISRNFIMAWRSSDLRCDVCICISKFFFHLNMYPNLSGCFVKDSFGRKHMQAEDRNISEKIINAGSCSGNISNCTWQ